MPVQYCVTGFVYWWRLPLRLQDSHYYVVYNAYVYVHRLLFNGAQVIH